MGLSSWIWFALAILAGVSGAALLLAGRAGTGTAPRDRRRWAQQRNWQYADNDPMLPSRWRYGTVHQGGHGRARNVASGPVAGPDGRRMAHVFDHEQAGRVTGVVLAVHLMTTLPVALELRLPAAPLPDDAGLDVLGPISSRHAFVTDVSVARSLVTPALVAAADAVGPDVPLLWAEDTWVLATIAPDAGTDRIETLLTALVDVAVALEQGEAPGRPGGLFEPRPPFLGLA